MPILKIKHDGVWEEVAGASWHTHTMNDITNFPTNLPADVLKLQTLVGDKSVLDQITEAVANKADVDHTHENILQLYDTVSGMETINISNAVSDCELQINLSSDKPIDFSNIKVSLIAGNIFNTVASNADGVVTGLNSLPEFTLMLTSTNASLDPSKIMITCTYQIDLNKVIVDLMHVENTVIDNTFSNLGDAADAKLTGDAITNINKEIDSLSSVAFSGDYNDLANKPEIINSNVTVSDIYDATSSEAMSGKAVAEALQTISVETSEGVQVDWNQADDTAMDFIKNKPTIPNIDGLATTAYVDEQIASIGGAGGSFEQVQSDWDEIDITSPAYIKNKPVISGGSTSVQADWNQMDNTQQDFIKNKPFYEYEGQEDLLPLTTYNNFSLDSIFNLYSAFSSTTYNLAVGETYIVVWDDVEYECVAQDAGVLMDGTIALGNLSPFGLIGNNEPFIIGVISGTGSQYFSLIDTQEGGSHRVNIAKKTTLVKCLDDKYLSIMKYVNGRYEIKDEYNPQPDWNEVSNNSAAYIKNKPFGTIPAGTVIVSETTVNCINNFDGGDYSYYCPVPLIGLKVGTTYDVLFDGDVYTITCEEQLGMVGLPHYYFFIFDNYGDNGFAVVASTQGEHTYSITIAEDVVQKIDAKYLPMDAIDVRINKALGVIENGTY